MNHNQISRTGEKVLGIIGSVFNIIAIILMILLITSSSNYEGSQVQQEIEQEIRNDPTLSPEDVEMMTEVVTTSIIAFGTVGWVLVALLAISTLFAIFAIAKLRKPHGAKTAGVLFIFAGLFAGVLSLTSILFYIAAIMCFVRKAPRREDDLIDRDSRDGRHEDTTYRPL